MRLRKTERVSRNFGPSVVRFGQMPWLFSTQHLKNEKELKARGTQTVKLKRNVR